MSLRQFSRLSVLSLVIALSACSLEQRSADSGMVRIQLNTLARSGGPSRLGTLTGNGMTLPTASSYYVVDVEGEGIPREIIEPSKCIRASPLSSALVAASPAPGEPERTEIELLVPVGANRKIRIVRVDLNIPSGSAFPQFGENPFRFKMRNPSYSVNPNLFILAEADIAFLNGDQSVTLVEKASPLPLPNQCFQFSGGNQPSIANADVELLNNEPWEGRDANGQPNPYTLWKPPVAQSHHFNIRGELKNRSNTAISPPGFGMVPKPTNNFSSFSSTVSPPFGPIPLASISPQQTQYYQWVIPVLSPISSPGIYSASVTFSYLGGTQGSIVQNFPVRVLPSLPPTSVLSTVSVTGYSNLYKTRLLFDRAATMSPIRPMGDLYAATDANVDMEPMVTGGVLEQFPTSTAVGNGVALAFSSSSDLFVGSSSPKSIRRFTSGGTELTPRSGLSSAPTGLAVTGNYVLFTDRTSTVQFYNYSGNTETPPLFTLFNAGSGSQLVGLAFDGAGNLYISDSGRHVIHRMTAAQVSAALGGNPPTAGPLVFAGSLGQTGTTDSNLLESRFNGPRGLAVDPAGNLYVAEFMNKKVRKISTTGSISTLPGPQTAYNGPSNLAWGGGALYLSDDNTTAIYRIPDGGIPEVFAGKPGNPGNSRLLVRDSLFTNTVGYGMGLAVDSKGALLISDASSVTRVIPSCPVGLENQQMPPRSFVQGGNCDFFFSLFSGGSPLVSAPPILRTKLSDANASGYHTQSLSDPAYATLPNLSGKADELVFDLTVVSTDSISISKAYIESGGGTWALPTGMSHSGQSIDRVRMKSDAGESVSTIGIALTTYPSPESISIPRKVLGAPIREFEIVYKATVAGSSIEYRKQIFRFNPVNPAQVVARLFAGTTPVENNFLACTTPTSWTVKAFSGSFELPVDSTTAAQAMFNGTAGTATGNLVSFTPSTGALNITNVIGFYKTLDGTKITPTGSWSGNVSATAGCVFMNVADDVAN